MIIASVFAFVATVLFMFALRPVANEIGLVDHPGGRKRHGATVPVIGGLAMSFAIGLASAFSVQPAFFVPTLLAIYLLVIIGTIDDRFDVPASVRLVAQAAAAMMIVFGAGIQVTTLEYSFFVPLGLGQFAALFTLLFIITLINAFNVIDGIDGLAGGLSFIALVALAVLGRACDTFGLSVVAASAVAGYLLFNLPFPAIRPIRSFMGDAGSTTLGLIIATIGIAVSQSPACDVAPVVGLYLVAIPVYDLFSATFLRLMQGRSIFVSGHEHLHHSLMTHGLGAPATLAVMLVLAGILAGIGIVGHYTGIKDGLLLVGWLGGLVLYYQALRRPALLVALAQGVSARIRMGPV